MFETFKEEYDALESRYDEKKYDEVVRDGGKIVESIIAFIFRNFPSTLKSVKQKQLFLEFEKKFRSDKGNKFLEFIARPTIGVSIGYYKQLCQMFANEDHLWLKENIAPALNTANRIRNKFAHSGNQKPGDDDASDLLDAFEMIIEELALQNRTADSMGMPLSSYLIYSSIIHNFDHIAQKEEDWKKIISDSRKIMPHLLEHLFYAKYYDIPIEDKEILFSDEELFFAEDKENKNPKLLSVYERVFTKLQIAKLINSADNFDLVMQKYIAYKKDKYDRRGVKPYTKLLEIIAEELINPDYLKYLKYAVMVKNKYLHNNEIDDNERIELLTFANSLNISSKVSYRIEKEVIRVINNELTLYQTLQSTSSEKEESKSISPAESILIDMIKKGTPENIVISVAESQNFPGDIYLLLSKYGNNKDITGKENSEKESAPPELDLDKETEGIKESRQSSEMTGDEMTDIIMKAFGNEAFGGNENQKNDGSDLKINIPLTLEEISTGIAKKIKFKRFITCASCNGSGAKDITNKTTCSACNGTGKVDKITKSLFGDLKTEVICEKCAGFGFENVEKCPACSGEGRIEKESIVSVEIPAGVIDGQILKLTGYGNAGRRGEPAGDLICLIEEIKHQYFQRREENLIYDLELSESEAEKGTDVTVPILNGKIKLKIPAGTKSGKLLRITGRGLAKLNSTDKGDMLVRISYN